MCVTISATKLGLVHRLAEVALVEVTAPWCERSARSGWLERNSEGDRKPVSIRSCVVAAMINSFVMLAEALGPRRRDKPMKGIFFHSGSAIQSLMLVIFVGLVDDDDVGRAEFGGGATSATMRPGSWRKHWS